jgi:hypothetical protein
MEIKGIGSTPSSKVIRPGDVVWIPPGEKGSAEYFTGSVRIDSRFQGSEPAHVHARVANVEKGRAAACDTSPQTRAEVSTLARMQAGKQRKLNGAAPGALPICLAGKLSTRSTAGWPALPGRLVGRACDRKIFDASNMVNDVVTGVVPDVDTMGKENSVPHFVLRTSRVPS